MVSIDRTGGSRHKLKYRKLYLSMRKMREEKHRNRFPREAVESPILKIFKT